MLSEKIRGTKFALLSEKKIHKYLKGVKRKK